MTRFYPLNRPLFRHYLPAAFGVCTLAMSPLTAAADWYVDPINGSDAYDGTAPGNALRYLQTAADLTQPGDTVYLMDGNHNNTVYHVHNDFYAAMRLDTVHSGAPGQPITYTAMPGHKPYIQLDHTSNRGIQINGASYINIEGIRFEGNNRLTNYQHASTLDPSHHLRDNMGILMGSEYVGHTPTYHPVHINIRNNEIFGFGAHGIAVAGADYVTIENNHVHQNGLYSNSAHSGISFNGLVNTDSNTGHKIVVRNNVLNHNENFFPFFENGKITDGNGLIVDLIDGYEGRILVENNVAVYNGGAGLQGLHSNNIDFVNNTAAFNSRRSDFEKANIEWIGGESISVVNNVIVADESMPLTKGFGAGSVFYDGNLLWDGDGLLDPDQVELIGLRDVLADPQFVDAANLDFQLVAASAAIDAGIADLFAQTDILGVSRPAGAGIDIGAYEYMIPAPSTAAFLIPFCYVLNWKTGARRRRSARTMRAHSFLPIRATRQSS